MLGLERPGPCANSVAAIKRQAPRGLLLGLQMIGENARNPTTQRAHTQAFIDRSARKAIPSGTWPHKVAAREAREEAGLVGHIQRNCIGTFEFDRRRGGSETICRVNVYALEVDRQLRHWAEAGQRSVRCCNLATALSLLTLPSLSILIEQFMAGQSRDGPIMARAGLIAA